MKDLLTDPGFLAGVETAILLPSFLLALWLPARRSVRAALVALFVLVFCALHGMLLVLPAMLLYAGFILMTGHLLCKLLCKRHANEPLACIPLGLAAIIVLVGLCSFVQIGTPTHLRLVYVLLFAFELVCCLKMLLIGARTLGDRMKERGRLPLLDSLLLTAMLFVGFSLVGRVGISLDYDSLWYGLRSDVMLAPFTGIYDKVVATGLVYTYSKGIEVLSLAFCFPATHSFVIGVNLMLGGMLLYAMYRTARLFLEKRLAVLAALLCAATPGIMNMTTTAKPDIATLLCQMIFVYFAARAIEEKDGDVFLLGVASAVVSFCFKSSAIVFTTALLVVGIAVLFLTKTRLRPRMLLLLLLPATANILLMARTFLITGMPLTQMGAGIFEVLGFTYKFPYAPASTDYVMPISSLFTGEGLRTGALRLLSFFFLPVREDMDHVAIAWGGPLFAISWLSLIVFILFHPKRTLARMREDKAYAFVLVTTLLVSVISLGSLLLLLKPDGNYYMLLYALTYIQLAQEMKVLSARPSDRVCKCLAPFAVIGVFLIFSTNWAGSVGFTPGFDGYNRVGYYDHAQKDADLYAEVGLSEIADFLEDAGGKRRVMLFADNIPGLLSLPAITESWSDICHWGNADLYESVRGLKDYFDAAGVEFLVVERAFLDWNTETAERLSRLTDAGLLCMENDGEQYILLRFVPNGGDLE